ncbi:hypothetical protein GCM10027299_12870 [Larkinella ripae]
MKVDKISDGLTNEEIAKNRIKEKSADNPAYILPPHLAKRVAPLKLLQDDLNFIVKLSNYLKSGNAKTDNENTDEKEMLTLQSYWYTIVVTYGKLFTSAGPGITSLNKKDCFKGEDDLLNTHEKLMDLRNTYIAHRSNMEKQIAIPYFNFIANGENLDLAFSIMTGSLISEGNVSVEEYQKLFEFLLNYLRQKTITVYRQLKVDRCG